MKNKLVFLKTDADFSQFRKSKQVNGKNLRLRIHLNTNQNLTRFGFIVPKKVLNKVTDRNVVKRRLKAILKKHLGQIKTADVLCFPSKTALKVKFADLETELINLLTQGRLWKS